MLILLDIDGVMIPANSWKKPEFHEDGFPLFSQKSVQALQRVISQTNAKILLTTSHKDTYSDQEWRNMFHSRGIHVNNIDRLPPNEIKLNRKDEILNWYNNHKSKEHFVIIDDDKLLNDLPPNIKGNLVLTTPSIGLTEELADYAISILKQKRLAHA